MEIKDALNARNKINLRAKITAIGEPRMVNMKAGGSIDVRDCTLTDDTGKIKLTLWGDECTKFNVGDEIEIANGYTNFFKGEVSLSKGKFGSLTKI